MRDISKSVEGKRLQEEKEKDVPWKKWGPYLSERQWGTVREDYSTNGDAWSYFTHDHARSRAYKWGEDGIAGFSDDKQKICFSLCLWNGADPILKERLFGLTNSEGNHGEDVKEYYFYIDSTPTHSYMKYLYKYPQRAYPYNDLVKTNRERGRSQPEYELLDTGVFDDDRYFDVFVEYAKADPDDILIRITACNRGPDAAELHLLPMLFFRNTWERPRATGDKPVMLSDGSGIRVTHPDLGTYFFDTSNDHVVLFTENETNQERIYQKPNPQPYTKDAFHEYLLNGKKEAVNPAETGTKATLYSVKTVASGESWVLDLRLQRDKSQETRKSFGAKFDSIFKQRVAEADEFFDAVSPESMSADERRVIRQAVAGMMWSKQHYYFDLETWLDERGMGDERRSSTSRNTDWAHMLNDDVISMPDKWEYPWYAAWDLAFHAVAFAMVDPEFAKGQLLLMLSEMYQHPNGQVPAYEWNFGDVNPPVHAWAAIYIFQVEREMTGVGDLNFLKMAYQKLLMNFTWWVNRKDQEGRNLFQGGFLGLDNIGVFDRSAPLPTGGYLEQADGTAWMAFFSQSMLQICLELSKADPTYEDMAQKFVEHFFRIAGAMDRPGLNIDELWDDEDGFYYDLLRMPDGSAQRLKIRSMVGLLSLCATSIVEDKSLEQIPSLMRKVKRFCERTPEIIENIAPPLEKGMFGRHLLAVLSREKLQRVLQRMLDEDRFLGPHGIRALSRWHLEHPFKLDVHGQEYEVKYMPAESENGMFGGNSNWRGPVWMPLNILIIRGLLGFYLFYGEDFKIEYPTGSGNNVSLFEVAEGLAKRLASTFLTDGKGRRPVYGSSAKLQNDPYWKDYILFYEYFNGDDGAGIGASHQTGWTGVVATLMQFFGTANREKILSGVFKVALDD
jgi:hypothetical protein